MRRRLYTNWKFWAGTGVVLVAVIAAGVLWIGSVVQSSEPAALAAQAGPVDTTGPATELAGRWQIAEGSQAEYRIGEILFGRPVTVVGRTDAVHGSVDLNGTRVDSAEAAVDLASVATDEAGRDRQFRNNLMDVSAHPQATFAIAPTELPADLGVGDSVQVRAPGELTLRGQTRPATAALTVQRGAAELKVTGEIPVVLADHQIPRSTLPGISVEDTAVIGVDLRFVPS